MLFGTFRKEEGSLVLNAANGGIIVKILDNKAQLEIRMANTGPPPE
jgi:hypothetical protein